MKIKFLFLIIECVIYVNGYSIRDYSSEINLLENDLIFRGLLRNDPTPLQVAPKPNTTVCYDFVGCFDNNFPFNNTACYLPVAPELINTEFLLFNKHYPNKEQYLSYRNIETIKNSHFDPALPLKIIVHGFQNDKYTEWLYKMKDAFLTSNVNVIIVAWGNGAIFPLYNNASSNTRLVGREIGLIVSLIRDVFFPNYPKELNVHCIGHSLGSHICGYASNAYNIRFNRVSALDPAGPLFEKTEKEVRIDPTDADFVDVYHTNGGSIYYGSFGLYQAVGHVDFYVNGGEYQPGCLGLYDIIKELINGLDPSQERLGCSHMRAVHFFTESIKSQCQFVGFKCKNQGDLESGACFSCENGGCKKMGYLADINGGTGSYFLMTMGSPPYCGYHYLFEMDINPNSSKTAGEIILKIDPNIAQVSITSYSSDINPKDTIRKSFINRNEIDYSKPMELIWNRKQKSFWQFSDPNAMKFYFDKIKISRIEIDETASICQINTEVVDKTPVNLKFNQNGC